MRTENHGGAWCPKAQITSEPREWLEIDLHSVHMITGTNTQGRFGNGVGVEYAEGYLLEYWRPRLGKWVRYRDIKGKEVKASLYLSFKDLFIYLEYYSCISISHFLIKRMSTV